MSNSGILTNDELSSTLNNEDDSNSTLTPETLDGYNTMKPLNNKQKIHNRKSKNKEKHKLLTR